MAGAVLRVRLVAPRIVNEICDEDEACDQISWQAQHLVKFKCHFFVAGAALGEVQVSLFVAGAALGEVQA